MPQGALPAAQSGCWSTFLVAYRWDRHLVGDVNRKIEMRSFVVELHVLFCCDEVVELLDERPRIHKGGRARGTSSRGSFLSLHLPSSFAVVSNGTPREAFSFPSEVHFTVTPEGTVLLW